ncbi:MAG: hypothetical protein E7620_04970 [Ruminococcaceae bacterium]|nr:hypothetical protein [Oscillospiraceae bacterium]
MYNESGYGTGADPYVYAVTPKKSKALTLKKLCMIAVYVVWVVGLIGIGAAVRIVAPLLAFIPVTLWMLIFFTWRYTQVSYEYSFWGGSLKVTKLYGDRTRRLLLDVKIRDLEGVFSRGSKAWEALPEHSIHAASSEDAERLVAAVYRDCKGERSVLYFEADEKARDILRYYNASAFSEDAPI